jgi:hypothetical protein
MFIPKKHKKIEYLRMNNKIFVIYLDKSLFDIFNEKIESFVIEMTNNEKKRLEDRFVTTIFTKILTIFRNLRVLNCHPFLEFDRSRLSFGEEMFLFNFNGITYQCRSVR